MAIYQITVKAVLNSAQEIRNVHHYEFFNYDPDATEKQEAVDAIDAAYKTNLQGRFAAGVNVYGYDVRRVDQAQQPLASLTATAGSWFGTNAGGQLAPQLALLTTFKAFTTFPRTTRTYHFPMTEGDNEGNGIASTTAQNAAGDWADDMLSLAITGQIDADKTAVKYTGSPPSVSDSHDVATHFTTRNWATQRRRKVGVGI